MPNPLTTRIAARFRDLRAKNAKGLVVYLTAGDPDLDATGELLLALERAGVDVIELGVPFSDPLADGPVIQRASERALRAGTTLRKILERFPVWRQTVQAPIILFSYFNPILQYGLEKFAASAAQAGVDGALVVDLTVEEAEGYVQAMRAQNLDTVFLASPTSTDARLERAAQLSTGFLLPYLAHRRHRRAKRDGFQRTAAGGARAPAHFPSARHRIWNLHGRTGPGSPVARRCCRGGQRRSACH